jgi:hypothetical protein
MKGKVSPVIGIRPTVIVILTIICMANEVVIPMANSRPKGSVFAPAISSPHKSNIT